MQAASLRPGSSATSSVTVKPPDASVTAAAKAKHARCLAGWNITVQVLTIVALVLTAIVMIFVTVQAVESNAVRHRCIYATGDYSDSNSTSVMTGKYISNLNSRIIQWDLQYTGPLLATSITGLQVHGPVAPGLKYAPLVVALCGSPGTTACDTSQPNVLTGTADELTTGQGLKPVIQAMRADPIRYYLVLCTATFPCTGGFNGELSTLFTNVC